MINGIRFMLLVFTRLFPVVLVTLVLPISLCAVTRHALVIGNDSYPGNRLQNARNDAKSVAEKLNVLGYLTTLIIDADRVTMARSIQVFSDSIDLGDLALVYYAGHGLQVAGENYLVPVDFHVSDEADAVVQGYPLSNLLDKLTVHGAKTQVIILDACRDNPFLGSRSASSGWASRGTSIGTFLAFGTSPGSTASDDPGANHGLFTKALLSHIGETSVEIDGIFRLVREDVVEESSGRQVPWTASSLIGSLHLNPQGDASTTSLSYSNFTNTAKLGSSGRGMELDANADHLQSLSTAQADRLKDFVPGYVAEAQRSLRGLNLGKAISILQAALELDPRSSIALRLLAVATHLAGRDIESENAIERAIAIDPKDARAYAYACLILSTQDSRRSGEECQKAIDLQNDLAAAHLGLSFALFAAGQGAQSYAEATKTITLDPAASEALVFRQNIPVQQHLVQAPYSTIR